MLRNTLLLAGLGFVLFGAVAWLAGYTEYLPELAWGGMVLLALLLERWRYRPKTTAQADADAPGWQATGERFVDPDTGRLMQVYFHAGTGERRYEPVSQDTAAPRS